MQTPRPMRPQSPGRWEPEARRPVLVLVLVLVLSRQARRALALFCVYLIADLLNLRLQLRMSQQKEQRQPTRSYHRRLSR
jgi:hypothetical protein